MTRETPRQVIAFWSEEVGESGWYSGAEAVDQAVRARFLPHWEAAAAGRLEHWRDCAEGTLAYLLITDQFPRNLFRQSPEAFATDGLARSATKSGIAHGFDLRTSEPLRQFFYLPLTHSESASDQERGVRLIQSRMPETGANTLLHARAHREVIRRFGRFPHRNDVLGRASSPMEQAFITDGGYGGVVRQLEAA